MFVRLSNSNITNSNDTLIQPVHETLKHMGFDICAIFSYMSLQNCSLVQATLQSIQLIVVYANIPLQKV